MMFVMEDRIYVAAPGLVRGSNRNGLHSPVRCAARRRTRHFFREPLPRFFTVFQDVFHRHAGMTPAEYRAALPGNDTKIGYDAH